jgi:hypothetical protein
MATKQEIRKFLTESHKEEDKTYIDLDSETPNRLSNNIKIRVELENLRDTIKILMGIEKDNAILNSLPVNEHGRRLIRQSLWSAIIISYAKCFSSAGVGKSKLEKRDYLNQADAQLLEFHNYILVIRNTYIAHGDENTIEDVFSRLYLIPDDQTNEVYATLGCIGIKTFSFTVTELEYVIKLVNIILLNLNKKIDSLYYKTMNEIKQEPFEVWLERAKK